MVTNWKLSISKDYGIVGLFYYRRLPKSAPKSEVGCNFSYMPLVNTLRPRQNGRNFPDNILKWIFLNENAWIPLKLWLKFIPRGLINNIPALVQIMAWRWPGHKPLSEQLMVSLLMHICVTWPQWAKWWYTQITIKVRAWMTSFVSKRDARAYRLFLQYLIFIVRMFLCKISYMHQVP